MSAKQLWLALVVGVLLYLATIVLILELHQLQECKRGQRQFVADELASEFEGFLRDRANGDTEEVAEGLVKLRARISRVDALQSGIEESQSCSFTLVG